MAEGDPKPVTQRQAYLDSLEEKAGIREKASSTVQERDSEASQKAEAAKKVVEEKTGTGQDNTEANKAPLLDMARKRLQIAIDKGDKAKAEQIRAQIKELENM